MTNILAITASDINKIYPLKGDMDVTLDFVPDDDFSVTFVTYSNRNYKLSSTLSKFRQVNGVIGKDLTVGGAISLFFTLSYNRKTNSWDITANNLASQGGSSGGGSGSGKTKEVLLTQDESGTIVPDARLGNNFRVVTNANIRFGNPVGYDTDSEITITVVQGSGAPHLASFDTSYALLDAQPAVLATNEKAINIVRLSATNDPVAGLIWVTETTPDKSYSVGYGIVSVLAAIGSTEYYQMGIPLGSLLPGAMFNIQDGETIKILRNGRGPECSGTIPTSVADDVNKKFYITGMPYGSGEDKRPTLTMLPNNRPSYNKAILNFEGKGQVFVKDLRVGGVRNSDSDARGICPNADAMNLTLNNVEIFDCNNGILTGNDVDYDVRTMFCDVFMYDVQIKNCGVGGPSTDPGHGYSTVGYTHSVYFGHNKATVVMERCSLIDPIHGDNLKCRSAKLLIKQVLCKGAHGARELEVPNGGWVEAEDCIFWKSHPDADTGNLALVGGNGMGNNEVEGLDVSRPRRYRFTNCRFQNDIPSSGRDMMFICNLDPEVPMEFIDCEFIGAANEQQWTPNGDPLYVGTVTVNGIRYKPSAPPIFTFTGGPLGPRKPVGYFPIPMENEA